MSLYSSNWLGFITETESVYCAVRTSSLYIKQICFVFKGLISASKYEDTLLLYRLVLIRSATVHGNKDCQAHGSSE
jgi:hypothetical protein